MRLVVLTTETPHHAYFVRQVAADHEIARVLCETKPVVPPFPVAHAFEDRRDEYERAAWFGGRPSRLADFAEVSTHESVNETAALSELREAAADLVVVFGTGRLTPPTLEVCRNSLVNLHGGDPEHYRGLDTHLWAVYHGDFSSLSTTLHTVNETIDGGRIVANLPLPLFRGMELHELRRTNTEVCVRLTLESLKDVERRGALIARPQRSKGRYYSFMPAELKEHCVHKFKRYTDTL